MKALVISGGGSKGAFAVGALKNLIQERGLRFDVVAGTSTGAAIAPLVILDRLDHLEAEYTSVRKDDILSDLPLDQVWSTGCVFNTQPLFNRIKNQLSQADCDALKASATHMFLAAICLQTGRISYFHSGPAPVTPPDTDIIPITDADTLHRGILASSNQPVLMPPVVFPVGSDFQYVDGGVREYAPLDVAIANGADEVYAILLSPKTKSSRDGRFKGLPSMLMRTISLLTEDVGYNDMRHAEICMASVRYHNELRARLAARFNASSTQVDDFFKVDGAPDPFMNRRVVNLFVIRPGDVLSHNGKPIEGLDFDPTAMRAMLDLGTRAARNMEQGKVLLAEG